MDNQSKEYKLAPGLMLVLSAWFGAALPVYAQQTDVAAPDAAAAPAPAGKIEEVVVTAQRRKQSLQKTPVAVTAVTGDGLVEQGVRTVADIAVLVPSLQIAPSGTIALRGVGESNINEKGENAVAVHVDGVYLSRPASVMGAGLFDIERVEVLRGPQGTLYGRNATSGSMNIITNAPTFTLGGAAAAELGNYNARQLSGMVNVPVSDTVALRVAFQNIEHDGYTPSAIAGHPRQDSADVTAVRASLLYKPNPGFSALLRVDTSTDRGISVPYGTVQFTSVAAIKRESVGTANVHNDTKYSGASVELNQDLGPGRLTYLGAWRRADVNAVRDFSLGLPYWNNRSDDRTVQQELRYGGELGRLNFITGLFYFKEKNTFDEDFGGFRIVADGPAMSESKAAYGQATYALRPDVRLTAGARYSQDKRALLSDGYFNGALIAAAPDRFARAHGSWNKPTWKVGAEYDVSPASMVFANLGTGYKSGNFGDGDMNHPSTNPACGILVKPENLMALELGSKNRFLNGRAQLNADAFYYRYTDKQEQTFVLCNAFETTSQLTNAGKARSAGLEFEGWYRPTGDDKLDFSLAVLKAQYTQFFSAAMNRDLKDTTLPKAPRLTVNIGYQHTFTLPGGLLTARLQSHYEASKYMAFGADPAFRQPSFTKSDALLTYEPVDGRWSLMGYVRNMENKVVVTDVYSGFGLANLATPRTAGVRLGVTF